MKRLVHAVLCLALAVACIWWIMHEPFDEDRLFRAIPLDVDVVSQHSQFEDRLEPALENPVLRSILQDLAGVPERRFKHRGPPDDFDDHLLIWSGIRRRGVSRLVETMVGLAPKEAIIGARLPGPEGAGQLAQLFISSYVGDATQKLRLTGLIKYGVSETYRGHAIYDYLDDGEPVDPPIRMAAVDGHLLGAISTNARSIYEMLDAYDGQRAALHPGGLARRQSLQNFCANSQDTAHLQLQGLGSARARVEALDPENIALTFETANPGIGEPTDWSRHLNTCARLFTTNALAVVCTDPRTPLTIARAVPGLRLPPWVGAIERPMALGLLGGTAARKFKVMVFGFSYPTLLVAVPIQSEAEVAAILERIAGVVEGPFEPRVRPLDETSGATYIEYKTSLNKDRGPLTYKDRFAVTTVPGYLLIASSAATLRTAVQSIQRPAADTPDDVGPWHDRLKKVGATGYAWIDTPRIKKTFGTILDLAPPILAFSGKESDQRLKRDLENAKKFLGALAKSETIEIQEHTSAEEVRLSVRIGPVEPGD